MILHKHTFNLLNSMSSRYTSFHLNVSESSKNKNYIIYQHRLMQNTIDFVRREGTYPIVYYLCPAWTLSIHTLSHNNQSRTAIKTSTNETHFND
jgi:hypothetical protein